MNEARAASRLPPELHYRLSGTPRGQWPGHHRSASPGAGLEFRSHAALVDAPGAGRIDLMASLRDPFGRWMLRLTSQRVSITVAVVADLTASMGADGPPARREQLAALTASLALSAWRTGDRFSFVGCDDRVRTDLWLPPTRQRAAGLQLAAHLRERPLRPGQGLGLLHARRHLPGRRGLVFLASDFHLPLPMVEQAVASLAPHEVVPLVLWPRGEFDLGDRSGLASAEEPESGRTTWVWWRPALHRRWRAAREARRDALQALFARRQVRPLWIEGPFDAGAVTRHFCR